MLILVYFASFVITIALIIRGLGAIFSLKTRNAIFNHPFVHAGLLTFVLAVWFLPWGAPLGALAATRDARTGKFRLYTTPSLDLETAKQRIVFSRILKDRYGIRSSPQRGCMVFSQNDSDYESAYDALMIPVIKHHFRRDIFAECAEAARSETLPPLTSQTNSPILPEKTKPSAGISTPPSPTPDTARIVERRATRRMIEKQEVVTYLTISGQGRQNTPFAAPLNVVLTTPAWDGFPDDPPLTVSQAVKIARQWHKQNGRYAPNIFAVNLQEKPQTSKRWAYTIHFDPNTDQKMTRGGEPAFVIVLFDGTVVGPVQD